MRIPVLVTALLLLPVAWANGTHDPVEACELDIAPVHAVDDGHIHYHHHEAVGAHFHGDEWFPMHHTHGGGMGHDMGSMDDTGGMGEMDGHMDDPMGHEEGGHAAGHMDPCDQTGIPRLLPDVGPIAKLSLADAVVGTTPSVIVRDEGYALDPQKAQTLLHLQGDAALAASGFPGSGTPMDPYIIEGYAISQRLTLQDTDACVVVRNNVVDGSFIEGPLVDPADLLRTLDQVELAREALAAARAVLEDATAARLLTLDDVRIAQADLAAWREARADYVDAVAQVRAELDAWKDARVPYLDDQATARAELDAWKTERTPFLDTLVDVREALAANSAALAINQERLAALRADAIALRDEMASQADVPELPDDLDAFIQEVPVDDDGTLADLLEQMQSIADQSAAARAERTVLRNDRADLLLERDAARANLDHHDAQKAALVAALASAQEALAIHDAGRDPILADLLAAREALAGHDAERDALVAALDAAKAIDADAVLAVQAARAERDLARDALVATKEVAAAGEFLWQGQLYKDLDAIVQAALDAAQNAVTEDAQLVLDCNGPCVHAYHNVVDDLRVNQNNARVGYATGGVIEDNRIFDVGQLRHFDGVFRDNEVGDLAHWKGFLTGDSPASSRAANVDGFNQGELTGNLFYGFVDLDFHGHHHSTGFFGPHSHYHGNDPTRLYGPDGTLQHDHTFRWTSVLFADNLVIDPAGQGLRYEDRNHAGDDRQANSENVEQLNEPHLHRSLIELRQNTIVGSLRADVFNADGIAIWSDDLTPVQFDAVGRIVDAVEHLGADILNTHRGRNDGWLQIEDNRVLDPSGGMGAYQVNDAKEFALSFVGNEAVSIGAGAVPGDISPQDLRDLDLAGIDWGGTQTDGDTGLLFARLRDGEATVCQNRLLGFDRGFVATMGIMEDVAIGTCADNTFSGDPYTQVRFTPYPSKPDGITQPVRDAVQEVAGDAPEHATGPTLDALDEAAAGLL